MIVLTSPLYSGSPRRSSGSATVLGFVVGGAAWLLAESAFCAGATNAFPTTLTTPGLAESGPSLFRVLGALVLVIGLFLGGAWLLRNGRLTNLCRSRGTQLAVLETRSLGARQSICVVAYGSERFLIGTTPAGINLLSHLAPGAESTPSTPSVSAGPVPFAQALAQALRGRLAASKSPGAA